MRSRHCLKNLTSVERRCSMLTRTICRGVAMILKVLFNELWTSILLGTSDLYLPKIAVVTIDRVQLWRKKELEKLLIFNGKPFGGAILYYLPTFILRLSENIFKDRNIAIHYIYSSFHTKFLDVDNNNMRF